MNNLLVQNRYVHNKLNNSMDYHSKSIGKSTKRELNYLLSKIDETYGQKRFKLNFFDVQLHTMENRPQEFRSSFKNRHLKKIMKKEQIFVKDYQMSKKKDYYKENANFNSSKIMKTELDYNNKKPTDITRYFKNNISLLNEHSSEIESHLDALWKNLGVNENYIYNFNVYKNMLNNPEEKNMFILNEIENLEQFKDVLNNLSKNINIREKKLVELKNLFYKINQENDLFNMKKILNESYSNIISYIESSIKIVEYYLSFKDITNQGNARNIKFNEEIVKKNFGINKYDDNYLLKMKTDTNFINISKMNEFKLNTSAFDLFKADPFLTCLYTLIQMPFEMKEKAKYCQYYLIQEGIFESLNKNRKNPQSHITIDAGISQDNGNLDISYYSGKLDEFIPLYSEYFEKIPEEQKLTFNLQQEPNKYFEHNYYPKIIICKDKATDLIKGICIYSVLFKRNEKQTNKIIIEHISSYNQEEMENIITNILEFIKNNNIFKTDKALNAEIVINLYYNSENEKSEIDKNIKNFIEKKLKFKSEKPEETSEGVKYQKMKQIITNNNNNDNDEDHENNNSDLCSNFFIKDDFTVNLVEKIIDNDVNSSDFNIRNLNPFNIVYIIYLMKKIYGIKNSFDYLLNKLNKFSTKKNLLLEEASNDIAMSLVLNDNFNNDLNINSFVKDLQNISKCITGNLNNELDLVTKLNIFPLFDGCMSVKYNNYFYNRIECNNIKLFNEKNTKQTFYLLNTVNDEKISMLISSNLNDNFKHKYLLKSNKNKEEHFNIKLNFEDIYNNLEEIKSDGKSDNKYIYIPAFSLEQKYEQKNVENSNEDMKNVINSFNEECKIEFLTEELIAKRNKKVSNNFEFNISKEELKNKKEYLIDDEFIIFILDSELMEKIGIIPIMSINVLKNNFIDDTIV